MNIFEQAAKLKIRFNFRGVISIEDLYDLSLEELNILYMQINKKLKEQTDEGLLREARSNKYTESLQLQLDLLKHIFDEKEAAMQAIKAEKLRKDKKARIMEIISNKQDQELLNKPTEELMKMLDEL